MHRKVIVGTFEWDPEKEVYNLHKHRVDFETAARAFLDPLRLLIHDAKHSRLEPRYFCLGKVDGTVVTVRFTWSGNRIRIIGAGVWRKERKIYEEKNKA